MTPGGDNVGQGAGGTLRCALSGQSTRGAEWIWGEREEEQQCGVWSVAGG
jgi:hypothetical protein